MHSPTPYEITTLPPQTTPIHGAMLAHEIPPGVQLVTLPGGIRTLAYTHQPPAETPQQAVPAAAPIPTWAKTTALLTPTIGGGIAAAGIGLSYAAPGLIAMSHALWSAVALIAAGTIALPLLLRTTRGRTRRTTPTHITQNITATGLFGRANGTINHH
ncbi:hypothetical protein [Streptomyces zhihengii]|uniref:SpdD-like protein n=1 Tax=Streptomyces zhihengii TaxID=1818004 RepID=A0ABS2UST8_9ACTN|nr:hypothetical protein [Streptomyces zhihengii]MBM9620574.1 hypothetical protein [Streptomyces zhihengii]